MPETEEKRETPPTPWTWTIHPEGHMLAGLPVAIVDAENRSVLTGGAYYGGVYIDATGDVMALIVEAVNQFSALRAELDKYKRVAEAAENDRRELVAIAAAMLIEVERYWKFDNYQQHAHSWHCKQDCLEKCHGLLEKMSHLAATDHGALMKLMNDIRHGKYRPIEEVIAALHPDPGANDGS